MYMTKSIPPNVQLHPCLGLQRVLVQIRQLDNSSVGGAGRLGAAGPRARRGLPSGGEAAQNPHPTPDAGSSGTEGTDCGTQIGR